MSVLSDEDITRLARKFALLNAVQHEGRADVGSVVGRILAEHAPLRKEANKVRGIVNEEVAKVNTIVAGDQKTILDEEFPEVILERSERKRTADAGDMPSLPDLPGAVEGQVVTRFPPEPNGFMHIGHAKAALIGSEYSKRYHGKFILRFDDTNPAAEKREYYGAFAESMSWLGIHPDIVKNASDDIPRFYAIAEKMLSTKKAFVCACTQEKMKEYRNAMIECPHRSQTVDENLSLWKKMLEGQVGKSGATLRFVGNMTSLNTTMRDPVLFRIVEEPHPLKEKQYRVWPTYDFDGPVEDSLDGVTHAMRSKEYELRDELYYSILAALQMRQPKIIEFSRLSLRNTTVSKRNLRKLIESGQVEGWDDPRLPTISGLRRRGFVPESIRNFILSMGVSKVESEPTWDLLESINRKILDPVAKRYFFVADPVRLRVDGATQMDVRLRNHPEKAMGERIVKTTGEFFISSHDASVLKEGSELRLIEAYNVRMKEVSNNQLVAEYLTEEKKEGTTKVQWVSAENYVDFSVRIPGPLLIDEEFNPASLKTANGVAEKAVGFLPEGEIIQFVRFGFVRMDKPGVGILAHK